jgi:hypothetical protein
MNANYTIQNTTVSDCTIDCLHQSMQLFFGGPGVSSVTNIDSSGGCPVGVDPTGMTVTCDGCPNGVPVSQQYPDPPGCPQGWILSGTINPNTGTVLNPCDDEGEMISCDFCDNGSPISNTFPTADGCPPGWIPSGSGNPCDGQGTGCDFSPSGGCATLHDLQGRFVNNMPNNFLANMYNGYNNNGCPFLHNRLQHHSDMINSNPQTFYGPNNPQGYVNPGPLWVNQKQSKVDFLQCIIAACCTGTGNDHSDPSDPVDHARRRRPRRIRENKKTKSLLKERFKQLAGLKPLYQLKEQNPSGTCHGVGDASGPYPESFELGNWQGTFEDRLSTANSPCDLIQKKVDKWESKLDQLSSKTPPKCNPKWQSQLMAKIAYGNELRVQYGC